MTSPIDSQQRPFNIAHRCPNRRRAVQHDRRIDPLRNRRLHRGQCGINSVDRVDNIRARLPEHDQRYRAFAIQISRRTYVLRRVHNIRHIRQMHRCALVVPDNDRLVVHRLRYLIVRQNIRRDISIRDLPFRQIRVLNAQRSLQIRHRQAHARQFGRIHLHPHRRQRAAARIHLPHALDLRQPLLDNRRRFVIQLVRAILIRSKTR